MRNLFYIGVTVGLFFFSAAAWAKRATPKVESALLVEMDANGEPVNNLIQSHLLASSKKITLNETFGTKCPPGAFCILGYWQKSREFSVTRKSIDHCGSVHYRGQWRDKQSSARLELVDHKTRICKDLRRYRWDVSVMEFDRSQRYFGGTPGVDPNKKTDCAEVTRDTMCTMQFMPSTCVVSSIAGEKLDEPVSASGGNPCSATAQVRRSVCEKGLDWEVMTDDDVSCAFEGPTICPAFMCMAPPSGCHYQPNNEVNELGCPTSCGDLVCGSSGPDIAP